MTTPNLTPATFSKQTTFAVGTNPTSVSIVDFNSDGNADLVTRNSGNENGTLLLGDGWGSFAAQTTFAFTPQKTFEIGATPNFISIGDFNGDGNADAVTANTDSDNPH